MCVQGKKMETMLLEALKEGCMLLLRWQEPSACPLFLLSFSKIQIIYFLNTQVLLFL